MTTHKNYHSYLIESLKDPAEAAASLEAVLEDGDLEQILLALRNLAEARRELLASVTPDFDWDTYDRRLLQGDSQILTTIATLLSQLGFKLSVTVKQEPAASSG